VSRLETVFSARKARGERVLVTYLCVGDPNADASFAHAMACVEAGADVLELGCPFSDPTADGEAIARAAQRSIANGGGLQRTLEVARRIRAASDVPIVLFGYYNPLFVRGELRAAEDAHAAGVDALLVVDLPPEEGAELRTRARELGLGVVPLVAPTSSESRVTGLAKSEPRPPFVYYVSVAGVTGSGTANLAEASTRAGELGRAIGAPCVVGFGVANADDARSAARDADGVVVGTAIVRTIEAAVASGLSVDEQASRVRALVSELSRAVHG
jgi:tryptophan synthase alpha chain